jgi:hypothetical protein
MSWDTMSKGWVLQAKDNKGFVADTLDRYTEHLNLALVIDTRAEARIARLPGYEVPRRVMLCQKGFAMKIVKGR